MTTAVENEKSNQIILISSLVFIAALGGLAWYYFSDREEEQMIRLGSRGKYVKKLQEYLLFKGAYLGTTGEKKNGVDGDFGALTQAAALKYLQKETFTSTQIKKIAS